MNKLDLTIPTIAQIFGDNRLEIFKKRKAAAAPSDYAICCGASFGYPIKDYLNDRRLLIEHRLGSYWTKTPSPKNNFVEIINEDWGNQTRFMDNRSLCIRPILPFSSISKICSNIKRAQDGILEVEFGEYPQYAAPKDMQQELTIFFNRKSIPYLNDPELIETGKSYTKNSLDKNQNYKQFQAEAQKEYKYIGSLNGYRPFINKQKGKKYIRAQLDNGDAFCCQLQHNGMVHGDELFSFLLSHKEDYQQRNEYVKIGKYVWIEVEPIKWLVDEENNIAITENLLFAGVPFKNTGDYDGDFENTDLYRYIDTYFSKEIMTDRERMAIEKIDAVTKLDKEHWNYELTQETRNPIITESNLTYKKGINIIFQLPQNLEIKNIQTQETNNENIIMIIQNSKDPSRQKTYKIIDSSSYLN